MDLEAFHRKRKMHCKYQRSTLYIPQPIATRANIRRFRDGEMTDAQRDEWTSPFALGFYATAVCEAAHASLAKGRESAPGVIRGETVSLSELS